MFSLIHDIVPAFNITHNWATHRKLSIDYYQNDGQII